MLTKVILEGPMGKHFGKVWNLAVDSPAHALRLIDANKPGVFRWIRANLQKYAAYRVVCEYEDGRREHLDNETVKLQCKPKVIRFLPITQGAGNQTLRIVAGIALIAIGFMGGGPICISAGASLLLSGIAGLLAPKPDKSKDGSGVSSYYFDGPSNTAAQGVPVQLTYGQCLVGSHTVSAAVTVDQLM